MLSSTFHRSDFAFSLFLFSLNITTMWFHQSSQLRCFKRFVRHHCYLRHLTGHWNKNKKKVNHNLRRTCDFGAKNWSRFSNKLNCGLRVSRYSSVKFTCWSEFSGVWYSFASLRYHRVVASDQRIVADLMSTSLKQ